MSDTTSTTSGEPEKNPSDGPPEMRPSSGPVDVRVRALASGGAGVADLPDGRVVFVPRTAPGDRARIRLVKSKARWATGSLQRVLDPGPDRVAAPCPLYATCGGCQLQHVDYATQLEWKGRFVADALERIGRLDAVAPPRVVPSPKELRYRNRITYTLRRLRDGHVVAGFHALGRPAHVVEVAGECLLPDERLSAAWVALRAAWGDGARHLPAGGRLQLTLRLSDERVELVVDGGESGWDPKPLRASVPAFGAIWHLPSGDTGPAGLVSGSAGPGGGPSFRQVNAEASALLRAYVLGVVGERVPLSQDTPSRAVDAYCGTGSYGRALAESGWTVLGIEVDSAAVETAMTGAPERFDVVTGRVEDELPAALPADLLIVNPPRAGLEAGVPEVVMADPPGTIVYVSCDPGTLARDVALLGDLYGLIALESFDLFPQTAHVETVAVLAKKAISP